MEGKKDSTQDIKKRASKVYKTLNKIHPVSRTALLHRNPFQLLVATILSAQCTDKQVNKVTPALFKKYRTVKEFGESDQTELESLVKSTGFYKSKARYIKGSSLKILSDFKGKVPKTMEELITLPGVARKTANIVLSSAFGINEGIAVDTHVKRVSYRLGLTEHKDPVKIEKDLVKLIPKADWDKFSLLLIYHGRDTCFARKPKCSECPFKKICPKTDVTNSS